MESDEVHAKQVDKLWNERKHIPHFKTNKQPQPARKLTCNSKIEFAIFVVVVFLIIKKKGSVPCIRHKVLQLW